MSANPNQNSHRGKRASSRLSCACIYSVYMSALVYPRICLPLACRAAVPDRGSDHVRQCCLSTSIYIMYIWICQRLLQYHPDPHPRYTQWECAFLFTMSCTTPAICMYLPAHFMCAAGCLQKPCRDTSNASPRVTSLPPTDMVTPRKAR